MTKTRTSKTTKPAIPAIRNEAWGFWHTMQECAAAGWPLAMTAIAQATGESLDAVRVFLDSRHVRHFADDAQNGLYRGQTLEDAVNAAIQRWMGWKIGRKTSKEYGIPSGLPYLTGWALHANIEVDAA